MAVQQSTGGEPIRKVAQMFQRHIDDARKRSKIQVRTLSKASAVRRTRRTGGKSVSVMRKARRVL